MSILQIIAIIFLTIIGIYLMYAYMPKKYTIEQTNEEIKYLKKQEEFWDNYFELRDRLENLEKIEKNKQQRKEKLIKTAYRRRLKAKN